MLILSLLVSQVVAKVLLGHCYGIPCGSYGVARLLPLYPRWLLRCCKTVVLNVVATVLLGCCCGIRCGM